MKAVNFARFGRASEVAEMVDAPEPASPAAGEILFELEVSPINPSDLLHFAGKYASPASLPSYAGGGVLGKIAACGLGVKNVKPGDRVILVNTERSAWRERFVWKAEGLIPVPMGDKVQLALLAANPPSAMLMLEKFTSLNRGDWVLQNAANSSVGTSLIQLAKARGLHTVNIVRRESVIPLLKSFGADVVLVDGPDLTERISQATQQAPIRLGIDAIAGEATGHIAACLTESGTVINYGLLSGQPCKIDSADVLFRNISLKGFWYAGWLSNALTSEIASVFQRLVSLHQSGELRVPVEAVYPIERLNEALTHAEREERLGKVVMCW